MNNYKEQMNKLVEEAYAECVKIVDKNAKGTLNGKKFVKGCRAVKIESPNAVCVYVVALGKKPITVDVNYVAIDENRNLFISSDGERWHPLNDKTTSCMVVAFPIPSDVFDVYENLYKQFYK